MTRRSRFALPLALLLGTAATGAAVLAAPFGGSIWNAAPLPETKGVVRQFTLTPHGDVDGFVLKDGTEVKVPKHLAAQLVFIVRPGDAVTVRGLKAWSLPLVDAASITSDATGAAVVDNGPPDPERAGTLTTATGKVAATLHGKRGEVNGALLEEGMILRLGPREAADYSASLQPGQPIAVRGMSLTTPLGTVIEVRAIGPSPDQLTEIGRRGLARWWGAGPDDRGPPPPPR